LIEDKFDPTAILDRAGRKFLDVIWINYFIKSFSSPPPPRLHKIISLSKQRSWLLEMQGK